MVLTREQLVEAVKHRKKHRKIGTAYDYIRNVEGCLEDPRLDRYLQMGDVKQWTDALRKSEDKLVYSDEGTRVVGGFAKDGGSFGKAPSFKDDDAGSNFVMNFECVVTTRTRDRDSDILEPQGARLDANMPLLWQHMPFEPIGKFIAETGRTEDELKARCGIVGTALGNDAAVLVKAGCLRISHGFNPIKWEPIEDEQNYGWHITDYEMMEISLVSIPANPDAVITAWGKGKFAHPLVKGWAEGLFRSRPPLVKGGWEPPVINLNVNLGGEKMAEITGGGTPAPAPAPAAPPKTPPAAGEKTYCKSMKDHYKHVCSCGVVIKKCPCAAKKTKTVVKDGCDKCKAVLAEKEEDGDDDEDPDRDQGKAEDDEDEEDKSAQVAMLGELEKFIGAAAKVGNLPKEAEGRLNTLAGMMADVRASTEKFVSKIGDCGKDLDVAGILTCTGEYMEGVTDTVVRMSAEVDSVLSVRNLPAGCNEHLGKAKGTLDTISTALSALTGKDGENPEVDDDPNPGIDDEENPGVRSGGDDDEDGEDGKEFDAVFETVMQEGELSEKTKRRLKKLSEK